jgi:hypothetical protein
MLKKKKKGYKGYLNYNGESVFWKIEKGLAGICDGKSFFFLVSFLLWDFQKFVCSEGSQSKFVCSKFGPSLTSFGMIILFPIEQPTGFPTAEAIPQDRLVRFMERHEAIFRFHMTS